MADALRVVEETPGGYRPLSPDTVGAYLEGLPSIAERLGGDASRWRAAEVGDGNLNLVFLVDGPDGSVCVKQALPYVRLVGESWPLPLSRAFFEHEALVRQARRVPDLVPGIRRYDEAMALIVMERLSPHIILRKGLIAGTRYPKVAEDLGRFMAETLFGTSHLSLPAEEVKRDLALFSANTAMCRITEDLVFTDPYREHELNRWTSPELDETVRACRQDGEWKVAIQELKHAFLTRGEALVHGDLHTGSVMVTENDTRVIDPEFAYYGPMGFDVGALMANYYLSFFSQRGHGNGDDYRAFVLGQVVATWDAFAAHFSRLWRSERRGDAFPASLYEEQGQADASESALTRTLASLQRDALGFAGAKMARRILGLAHVEDLESIEDQSLRAGCERRALTLARELIVDAGAIASFANASRRAIDIEDGGEIEERGEIEAGAGEAGA